MTGPIYKLVTLGGEQVYYTNHGTHFALRGAHAIETFYPTGNAFNQALLRRSTKELQQQTQWVPTGRTAEWMNA